MLATATLYAASGASALGVDPTIFELGSVLFTLIVAASCARLALVTRVHSIQLIAALVISAGAWVAVAFLLDAVNADGIRGGMALVFGQPAYWLLALIAVCAAQLPTAALQLCHEWWAPTYYDLVRELQLLLVEKPNSRVRRTLQRALVAGMRSIGPRRPTPAKRMEQLNAAHASVAELGGRTTKSGMMSTAILPRVVRDFLERRALPEVSMRYSWYPAAANWELPATADIEDELLEWPGAHAIVHELEALCATGADDESLYNTAFELLRAQMEARLERRDDGSDVGGDIF